MRLIAFLLGLLGLLLASSTAFAEKRVVLVVGNSAYQNGGTLPQSAKDASAIARMFSQLGFHTVHLKTDLTNLEFKQALYEFRDVAADTDIALFYFVGRGITVGRNSYFLPVDAQLVRAQDAEDHALSLDRIVHAVEPARRLRLLILDASRNNPFPRSSQSADPAQRSGPTPEIPSSNTFFAYSVRAGAKTLDDGDNPFTAAVLKHLAVIGRDIRISFGHVRDDVIASTRGKQEPFVSGYLDGSSFMLSAEKHR